MLDTYLKTLTEFGIDDVDAQSYCTLLRCGPTTVGALSLKLETDRGKVYRSIKKLQSLGMITTSFTNPIVCSAKSPSDALNSLLYIKKMNYLQCKDYQKNYQNN